MPDDPAAVPVTRVNTAVTGGRYELPVYPYVEPAELKGKLGRHPVVIVGAGLAGLAAACDFSLRGIPAVVLDEDDTVGVRGASSRAICYARKSLEYFRRLGVYERVAAKGVPWSVARSYAGAQEIDRIDFADAPGAESCQPPFVNLQQFYVEWFLVDRIYELAVVDLRWKTRVIGVTAHPDHVEVHVETPSGRYTLDTGWLIDCSGGRSAVPGWLGSPAAASDVLDRWCVCDVRLPEPPPPERRCWIEAPFNDGNSAWQQPMADGVARFDYQLPATVDPVAASSVEAIGQRLQRQFGSAAERAELIWIGAYEYRSRCLQQFRRGRTLFAGDAAHLMSPFGARGGSAALQDAENLVWKLALVLQGRAPEALLASYEDERRPAALEDIRATEATARFLAPRSAAERELRAAVLAQARGGGFARELINPGRMSVPYAYDRSMLSLDGRPCRPLPNVALTLADGREGDLVALQLQLDQPLLGVVRGSLPARLTAQLALALPERYPVRFVLLHVGSGAPADGLPVIVDREGALAGLLGLDGTEPALALVRPDLYCAGVLHELTPATVERAVRCALGLELE